MGAMERLKTMYCMFIDLVLTCSYSWRPLTTDSWDLMISCHNCGYLPHDRKALSDVCGRFKSDALQMDMEAEGGEEVWVQGSPLGQQ